MKQLSLMNIPETFNGKFLFFQLDGKFVGSWKIENGVRKRAISYIKPLDPKSDLANSRISNYTYNCVVLPIPLTLKLAAVNPTLQNNMRSGIAFSRRCLQELAPMIVEEEEDLKGQVAMNRILILRD